MAPPAPRSPPVQLLSAGRNLTSTLFSPLISFREFPFFLTSCFQYSFIIVKIIWTLRSDKKNPKKNYVWKSLIAGETPPPLYLTKCSCIVCKLFGPCTCLRLELGVLCAATWNLGLLHACAFEGGHFPQVNFQVPEAIEPKAGSAMYKCEVRPELVYCGTWCVRMGPIMCSSQKPDACATEGRGGRVRQARQG